MSSSTVPAWRRRLDAMPGLVPSALLAGLVFLFEPAQIYHGNEPFLYFPFAQFALLLVPAFLALFVLLVAITSIGPLQLRRALASVVAGVAMAAWAMASFVAPSRGMLDGRSLLEMAPPAEYLSNGILWVAFAMACGLIAWRFPRAAHRFLAALLALLALQAAWITATDHKPWRPQPAFDRLTTLSSERNVLVILLDAFQADFFGDILAEDPSLAAAFDGFTWFPNAMGSAMTTYLAMPTIHSGVPVRSGDGILELYHKDIVEGSFMAKLASAGYDAMLVNPILNICPRGVTCDHYDQLVHGQPVQLADGGLFLLSVSLFRIVPYVLKPSIYRDGEWLSPWRLTSDFAQTSNSLLDHIGAAVHGGAARPTARFLHMFSSHGPAALDAACRPVHDAAWDRASAVAQDHCALRHVARLLQGLREQHVFDQTAVLVIADHGSGLPRDPQGFVLGAGASPLLLAKPFAARAPLATSTQLVGLEDVSATVCAWTRACTPAHGGTDVMAAREGERHFPFITYVWSAQYYGADAVPLDNVFEVEGRPQDVASWTRTTNLPTLRVSEVRFAATDAPVTYGFGWSGFEEYEGRAVRWAVGTAADLYVDLDPAHDERLEFDVMTHPGDEPQQVLVEVNGREAGTFPVTARWTHQQVVIPRGLIGNRADRILMRFRHDNPPSGDERRLAVLFDQVRVSPVQ